MIGTEKLIIYLTGATAVIGIKLLIAIGFYRYGNIKNLYQNAFPLLAAAEIIQGNRIYFTARRKRISLA